MDIVTHALCGAVAGQTLMRKPGTDTRTRNRFLPAKVAAGAAIFPDLDFILFPVNPLVFLADWHQSITHSLVLAPVWGALLTALCVLSFRTLRQQWQPVYCAAVLGLLSHILLDVLTVYGTRMLYPLSTQDFSLGTTFVIDPVVTLILAAGLLFSLQTGTPRMTSVLSMTVLGLYVVSQWHLKTQAEEHGAAVITHPADQIVNTVAMPQPFSPFHWLVIVKRQDDQYAATLIDLLGQSQKLARWNGLVPYIHLVSAYRSPSEADWQRYALYGDDSAQQALIEEAWQQQALDKFRDFAVFPALYRIDHEEMTSCVWFTDLRYHISVMLPPFRYGMCREGQEGDWKPYRLRYFTINTRHALG